MEQPVSYDRLEKQYDPKNHNRKTIDGSVVGSSKCVGFCAYCEHPGFLTKKQRDEHNCIAKVCFHYIAKTKSDSDKDANPFANLLELRRNQVSEAFSLACSLTKSFEGMRFMSGIMLEDLSCELTYVTISNAYDLDPIVKQIEKTVGLNIRIRKLDYSFENAAHLILKKDTIKK